MMKMINRKDFLKLSSLIPAQLLWSKFRSSPLLRHQSPQKQNVLIIVFDTWSGENLSLFGYRRETSPELEKLARKAIVYHHHYAAAPWTMPGTASLFSGLYPWTHRVFDFDKIKYSQNIFGFFSAADYFIQTYTHNPLADGLINVYAHEGQIRIPREQFFLALDPYFHEALERDAETFYLARHQIFMNETEVTNSLFLPKIVRAYHRRYYQKVLAPYMERYPEEPPVIAGSSDYFVLDDPFNWMVDTLPLSPKPFLHYYHFYPPHGPYRPQKDFMDRFEDGWEPAEKDFPFPGPEPQRKINRRRREYDCYVSDVDAQFANLYRRLEQSGILEDTWLVLTSDHGELFERGVIGHSYITLHEPLLHIPLLIFPPGHQEGRIDIFDRTSAVDVLPTLLHLTGQPVPPSLPGMVLPPFNPGYQGMPREIFSMNPRHSQPDKKMKEGTLTLLKDNYKLTYHFGHEEMEDTPEYYELYDLLNDPEERVNLYDEQHEIAQALRQILFEQFEQAEAPYGLP